MRNIVLGCLCAAVFLFGCKNDDDVTPKNNLSGEWDLVLVFGGLAGLSDTIPKGDIMYTFNEGVLKVENNYNQSGIYTFLQTGEYTYEQSNVGGEQILTIDTTPYELIRLSQDFFELGDNRPVDGLGFKFVR